MTQAPNQLISTRKDHYPGEPFKTGSRDQRQGTPEIPRDLSEGLVSVAASEGRGRAQQGPVCACLELAAALAKGRHGNRDLSAVTTGTEFCHNQRSSKWLSSVREEQGQATTLNLALRVPEQKTQPHHAWT